MLAHVELALVVLDVAPHAVEVNRVRHHRVVHRDDPEAFAVGEAQGLGVGELDAVERPREPAVRSDAVRSSVRLTTVGVFEHALEIGVVSTCVVRCRVARCPDRRVETSASSSACLDERISVFRRRMLLHSTAHRPPCCDPRGIGRLLRRRVPACGSGTVGAAAFGGI